MLHGKKGTVVWLRENPSEIEPMDEYILEFEDHQRRFYTAAELGLQHPQTGDYREDERRSCQ